MSFKMNFRDQVAQEMIRKLEEGTAPWQKPWEANVAFQPPYNPVTDKPYRGLNSFWLDLQGYDDPRWMTYNQAKSIDAQVAKGSKATRVEYWQWTKELPLLDENGEPIHDEEGKQQKQAVQLERPRVFYAAVFNGSQIEGLEPHKAPELTFDPVIEAEQILEGTGVKIHHDQADRAFYSRMSDEIHLPHPGAFKDAYEYYATALHEVGHATGAPHRMVRDKGPFGSELYAKEELMVEMASYMMSRELGLGHYPDRHAAYVGSWLKAIEEDKNYLFQAAAVSEKIRSWVMEPEMRPQLEQAAQLAHEASKSQAQSQGVELSDEQQAVPEIVTEEALKKRYQQMIEQEEARVLAFRPRFIGDERSSLIVHEPQLVAIEESPDHQVARFAIGNDLEIAAQSAPGAISDDLVKAVLATQKGMESSTTPTLSTLELQQFIDLPADDSEAKKKRLVGYVKENGEDRFIQIDFTARDSEILERFSTEFKDELTDQAYRSRLAEELKIKEAPNLQPLFISSNRQMLDRVSNFLIPETPKSDRPAYIQSASRTKKTTEKLNEVILASGQILNGTIGDEKLAQLAKVRIGQPEIDFDEKTGMHTVSFNALVLSDKQSLVFEDNHGRAEVTFQSRDKAKIEEFAQTFMNGIRALEDLQLQHEQKNARQYINVPFEDIVKAKAAGALFDYQARSWYAPEGYKEKLAQWMEKPQEQSMDISNDNTTAAGIEQSQAEAKERLYLDVPFNEKNAAKELGAKWDKKARAWYVPDGVDPASFEKWVPRAEQAQETSTDKSPAPLAGIDAGDGEKKAGADKEQKAQKSKERTYLAVPYTERHQAKKLGARWDKKAKLWYAPNAEKLEALSKWAAKDPVAQAPTLDPVQEFAQALKDHGVEIKGAPVMDGKWHRASLEGEPKKQNASYIAYSDGVPNGIIHNFKTDEKHKWVAIGQQLSEEQKLAIAARSAETKKQREKELAEAQDKAARKAFGIWRNAKAWATQENSSYLRSKGVNGYGVKVNDKGNLLIPLRDTEGRIHSLQTIKESQKLFTKEGRKTGLFHVIDPQKAMQEKEKPKRIVIAEGYATGSTMHEATKLPTVVAFDSSNLKPVAEAIRKKYPEAEILIAADNDHTLVNKPPYQNVGKVKAEEAARAVDGKVITPSLTDKEKEINLTDWNDLQQKRGKKATFKTISDEVRKAFAPQKQQRQHKAREAAMAL